MRCYACECMKCRQRTQISFHVPYPEIGDVFPHHCGQCGTATDFTRSLTKKALAELRRAQEEAALKQSIVDHCAKYGFTCRFLYESVIITTPVSDWSFCYHDKRKTLRHESTVKINFETGDYAKTHQQFSQRNMTCLEVIDYIAAHDQRVQQRKNRGRTIRKA